MFRTKTALFAIASLALVLPAGLNAQTFAATGTTSVSVSVAAEASLSVGTATTSLTTTGTIFNDFTGTTNLTYKVRTTKTGGAGTITAQVTTDFTGNGPSVANSGSTGDTLSYTCTARSESTRLNSSH